MALQTNPFGYMSERITAPRARQSKRSAPKDQRYWQPQVVPDSPRVLMEDILVKELTTEWSAAFLTITNLSIPHSQDPWSPVVAEIDGLMAPSEEEDVATEHAYRAARAVVESAYGRLWSEKKTLVPNIPPPVVMTDDRGGVKLAWRQGAKHVRVNFGAGPEMRSYLYFESPTEHNVEDLQPSNLSRRLDWLLTP